MAWQPPLAPGHGADGHGHAQAVALIVRGPAYLGATDQRPDMLGAHLYVGLEAAAAEDDGSTVDVCDTVVVHAHPAGMAMAILQNGGDGGAVTDLDAHLLDGREPAPRKADAFVRGAHHQAARPDNLVAFTHAGETGRRLHPDVADAVHPEHGVLGVLHQDAGQYRVGLARRDPHQVAMEIVEGVGLDAVIEVFHFVFDTGQEHADLARVVKGEAQHATAPVRVPSAHLAGGFFEHHDVFGPVLLGRNGGSQGSVAGANDDNVILGHERFSEPRDGASLRSRDARWAAV